MVPANLQKRHLALILALSAFALTSAHAVSAHSRATAQLQELADNAALAGVNALAGSADQPQDARLATAIAAAKNVMTARPGMNPTMSSSIDRLTMSVVLDDIAKGTHVTATAHYIPPSDGRSSQQAANVSVVPRVQL